VSVAKSDTAPWKAWGLIIARLSDQCGNCVRGRFLILTRRDFLSVMSVAKIDVQVQSRRMSLHGETGPFTESRPQ